MDDSLFSKGFQIADQLSKDARTKTIGMALQTVLAKLRLEQEPLPSDPFDLAIHLLQNDRQDAYGCFVANHLHQAHLFKQMAGKDLTPSEVALLYVSGKIVRHQNKPKLDNIADGLAYLAFAHVMTVYPHLRNSEASEQAVKILQYWQGSEIKQGYLHWRSVGDIANYLKTLSYPATS